MKAIESLVDGAIGEILSSINKNFDGSHSVVIRALGYSTQSGLIFGTFTSAFISKLHYMIASSNIKGLKGLYNPA